MTRTLTFSVPEEARGQKVGNYLRRIGLSHTLLVMIKRQGMLLLNGAPVYATVALTPGDTISVTVSEEFTSDNIAPEEGNPDILYEDEDLLAVNKEAALPVHPSRAHVYGTLAGQIMKYYEGQDFVFRAVNRLDKGTSGIVMIAKNPLSANWFASRADIQKEYIGFTEGVFPESLTIMLPIAREAPEGMRRVVRGDGEFAVTHAKRLALYDGYSMAGFVLGTGRTHQIRVHSAHIGHPLLGDPLYAPDADPYGLERQALHAARVTFTLPYSDKRVTLEAPLPPDLQKLAGARP